MWRKFTIDEVCFCLNLHLSVLLKLMLGIKLNGLLKKSDTIYLIVRGCWGDLWEGVNRCCKERHQGNSQEWRMVEVTASTSSRQKEREEDVPVNKCFYQSMLSMMKNRLVCFFLLWSFGIPSLPREENHCYPYMSIIIEHVGYAVPSSTLLTKGNLDCSVELDSSFKTLHHSQ